MLVVAFDLSYLVKYITRFTEESFASLIAIIFIYEAIKKLIGITKDYPVNLHPEIDIVWDCRCMPPMNDTNSTMFNSSVDVTSLVSLPVSTISYSVSGVLDNVNSAMNGTNGSWVDWAALSEEKCKEYNGTLVGDGCSRKDYVADVFFLSVLLFLGTYTVASSLKAFKLSGYFPSFVSHCIFLR